MNTGRTVFAQLMEFLPWSTFDRIVGRYDGNRGVRKLPCAYRESLRDIEACLSAQAAKLYHMGFREPVHRSTLADANETRDWRIYAELAQRLIAQARRNRTLVVLFFKKEHSCLPSPKLCLPRPTC
jgi:hypothetical protein